MRIIQRILLGAVGGFFGGSVVGLIEAAVIAMGGGLAEYYVFLFGALAYGLFGAAMGAGIGFVSAFLSFFDEDGVALATAAGLAAAALLFVVGRFRVVRDVFGEALPITSGTGVAVHVALLVVAAVLAVLLGRGLARAAEGRGAFLAGLIRSGVAVALGAVLAFGLTQIAGGKAEDSSGGSTAKGPNVLLIIADTLRADHIGPYGASDVNTPALNALARDAVVFESAFAHSSWTRPSVATILTSLYPASHSVMHKTDLLPEDVTTIAEAMKAEGYATSGFVTNINVAPSFNFQQGFDTYEYLAPNFFFGATDSGSKLALYGGMRLIRERFLSRSKFVYHYYQDADTVNLSSLPWLDRHQSDAFFTLIHYMDPHDPYFEIPYNGRAVARVETPDPDPSRADELRTLYVSNIEYLDGFLDKIFAGLKASGVYDDTVILIVSDHGEEFYEHGGWWHGTTMFEEQIHVPLIIKLPGNRSAGTRVTDLAGMIDVMPTILALAGAPKSDQAQGRNLFGSDPAPQAIYGEEDHEGNVLESIRTPNWKLIRANVGNPRGLEPISLYNLDADPGEQNNLAATETARVQQLEDDLALLRQFAAGSAVSGSTGSLDSATQERLEALGYLD